VIWGVENWGDATDSVSKPTHNSNVIEFDATRNESRQKRHDRVDFFFVVPRRRVGNATILPLEDVDEENAAQIVRRLVEKVLDAHDDGKYLSFDAVVTVDSTFEFSLVEKIVVDFEDRGNRAVVDSKLRDKSWIVVAVGVLPVALVGLHQPLHHREVQIQAFDVARVGNRTELQRIPSENHLSFVLGQQRNRNERLSLRRLPSFVDDHVREVILREAHLHQVAKHAERSDDDSVVLEVFLRQILLDRRL
jgi:hypothetical protein